MDGEGYVPSTVREGSAGGGGRLHRRRSGRERVADAHGVAEGVDRSAFRAVGGRFAAVVVGRPLAVDDAEECVVLGAQRVEQLERRVWRVDDDVPDARGWDRIVEF